MADLSSVRALVMDVNLSVHGMDVTVTRPAPDDEPIVTRGIWPTPDTESVPVGSDFSRREPVQILALSRIVVATVPRGTRIVGPPRTGGADRIWKVDGIERVESEVTRCIVLDVTDSESP